MLNVKPKAPRKSLRRAVALGAVVAAAALTGCTSMGPMAMTRNADREMACVAVQWTQRDQIASICGRDNVYGLPNQACLVDGYRIVSQKPRDWNDETAMISLGHELFHALGAMHN